LNINIDLDDDDSEKTIKARKNETVTEKEPEIETTTIKLDKIVAHDALTADQVDELRKKTSTEKSKLNKTSVGHFFF
jgi:hypothetical protein